MVNATDDNLRALLEHGMLDAGRDLRALDDDADWQGRLCATCRNAEISDHGSVRMPAAWRCAGSLGGAHNLENALAAAIAAALCHRRAFSPQAVDALARSSTGVKRRMERTATVAGIAHLRRLCTPSDGDPARDCGDEAPLSR